MTYRQARADHEYLWAYGPMEDISGAYVDQDDLKLLLESPNKVTARRCYESQIIAWFQNGPDKSSRGGDGWKTDQMVREIAARYGSEDDLGCLI